MLKRMRVKRKTNSDSVKRPSRIATSAVEDKSPCLVQRHPRTEVLRSALRQEVTYVCFYILNAIEWVKYTVDERVLGSVIV